MALWTARLKMGVRTSGKLWPIDQGNLVITFYKWLKKLRLSLLALISTNSIMIRRLCSLPILSTLGQVEFTNTGCDRSVLNLLQGDGEAYCHSAWRAGRALPRLATTRDRSGAPQLPPWPCVTPIAGPTPSGERLQDPGLSELTQICTVVINFKHFYWKVLKAQHAIIWIISIHRTSIFMIVLKPFACFKPQWSNLQQRLHGTKGRPQLLIQISTILLLFFYQGRAASHPHLHQLALNPFFL